MSAGGLGQMYATGQVIVREGEPGDSMFSVQEGKVEVVRKRKSGGEIVVGVLGPGDIFGEMAIFEREVRSATVRAMCETRVLTVDKKTFMRRVQEDPTLAFNLVRMMSQRIRSLHGEIGERRTKSERRKIQDRRRHTERRSDRTPK